MDARVQRMRRSLSMWVQCIGGKCVSNMRVIGGVYDGVDPGGQKCQSSYLTLGTRSHDPRLSPKMLIHDYSSSNDSSRK